MDTTPATPERSPAERLVTPVQYLKGVGVHRAEMMDRLGLHYVRDILFFFPRDYQDLTDQRDVGELEEGKLQSVRGMIEDIDFRTTSSGGSILGVLVRTRGGHLRAVWFNQPFLRDKFSLDQRVMVSGKPKFEGMIWQMSHPRVEVLAEGEEEPLGKILPVYSLTEGLAQWQMRKIVRGALEDYVELLDDVFPAAFLEEHKILPLHQSLRQIHGPDDQQSLAAARRRLVYQELLVLQLALAIKRQQQHDQRKAPPMEPSARIDARIRRLFPFDLTPGQEQAIREIAADMAQPLPMNRLLQGDVGCGKTLVAIYAMLLCVAHGHQAVLMAPTEVLARQHVRTLEKTLALSQVRRAQLIGGMSAGEREATLVAVAAGQVDIVVGTQAILQEGVDFARLGLVVIDEQHKFGVRQRAHLKQAGFDPHYLVMSATPIPRTMTMTLFGDLDASTIRDLPPGRQKVNTYLAGDDKRAQWWEFFRKKLREGRQGYIVAPLVEESETAAATSLEETYERLANGELAEFRLGLIHGRMTPAEKDAAMAAFRSGEIQALVSTSVIEVGVDVPNATLMTIESGHRFGLAQLHQLRGRIGRGSQPGFCCVFADPQSEESEKRLEAFVSTTDGFKLAEMDFAIRGPGDLFGTRQHGMPPLRIADLVRDAAVVEEARRDAQSLIAADPGLSHPEYALLRKMVVTRYGKALELGDVG